MRVIAGRCRGRRLKAPSWDGLRPTSDRLKETLFNILAPEVAGARVLDGFAGTGALGIEALSRGASAVVFVDADRRALELVAANLAHCGITQGYTMIRGDVASAISRLPATDRFDLVLLDPPYEDDDPAGAVALAAARLAAGGTLVLEHAARRPVPERVGGLLRVRQTRSGDSALAFYRPVNPGGDAGDARETTEES